MQHRTPLRYPGGKQRLAPFINEILEANDVVGWEYVEPYAGGAGVGIELLLDHRVSRIHLNDASPHIAALWSALLTDPDRFCARIRSASLTLEEWQKHKAIVRNHTGVDTADLGFSTFYLNRCNRSGVLTAGVIGGRAQSGRWRIDARFPRNELIQRVEKIAKYAAKITISSRDAEDFMRETVNSLPAETLVYCDPPYYARAKRLYLSVYREDDHIRLAKFIQCELRRPWIVSYDYHARILNLYAKRRKFSYLLQYSAVRACEGREVFVFSDGLAIPATSSLPQVAASLRRCRQRLAKLGDATTPG